jgi:RHS repeat-associated protein
MPKPCSTYLHQVLYAHSAILCPESDLYFYHGDHLGSASWITDARGDAIQHLQYLPFGETRVDQRTSYWNSRYSFSGKEKDEESGYSYFGARYYDSDLSIWLSVDPLSDKYPGLSPYVYCANNPIRLIDPDGRKLRFAKGSSSEFKAQFKEAIQHLKKNKVDGTAAKLERSRQTYYIQEVKTAKEVTADLNYDSGTGETKTTINWCPTCGVETTEGVILSPTTSLNHEFGHALLFDETVVNGDLQDAHNYAESIKEDPLNPYGNENEQTVITGIEQRTAKALGEIGEDGVTRTNHQGKSVTTSGPTSNQKMETPIE